MVQHVNLRNFRASLTFSLALTFYSVFGQPVATDSLVLEDEIVGFSQDRTGNIFLTFKDGAITKYSDSLDSLISYSPTKLGQVSLIEAWHGFQVFAFYKEFQEFVLFDRFLTQDTRYPLSETLSNYVDICTISGDQNLWLFEENQLQLIKVNLNIREIDLTSPLEFVIDLNEHQITYIKEYQNLVFLVDRLSGIYIFDNLGNYLRKINVSGITHCSFWNESIFYLTDNKVHIINIYKGDRATFIIPKDVYQGVLGAHKAFYLIQSKKVIKWSSD